jgi:hypothetical protein
MRERDEPMTQVMKASAVRDDWSQILNQVFRKETRVLVEKSGVPVAAIIAPDDLDRLNKLAAEWDEPFQALDRTREAFHHVPNEELEREIPKAVEHARAQRRAARERTAPPA